MFNNNFNNYYNKGKDAFVNSVNIHVHNKYSLNLNKDEKKDTIRPAFPFKLNNNSNASFMPCQSLKNYNLSEVQKNEIRDVLYRGEMQKENPLNDASFEYEFEDDKEDIKIKKNYEQSRFLDKKFFEDNWNEDYEYDKFEEKEVFKDILDTLAAFDNLNKSCMNLEKKIEEYLAEYPNSRQKLKDYIEEKKKELNNVKTISNNLINTLKKQKIRQMEAEDLRLDLLRVGGNVDQLKNWYLSNGDIAEIDDDYLNNISPSDYRNNRIRTKIKDAISEDSFKYYAAILKKLKIKFKRIETSLCFIEKE